MKFGKTIKIFLIDGDPNGRMACEISNWTGKAYKIPRNKIKDCVDRRDLENTGIYFLLGKNEVESPQVYIGEAEVILKRLNQHLIQKDFWNEAIVFVSKDDNLNKAHIKYLENRFHELAKQADRYVVDNNTTPTKSSISESDENEMEEFIFNVKILVNTLGHKIFDEKRETVAISKQDVFSIKSARGTDAKGINTSDGFVVFKGSKASVENTKSLNQYWLTQKQKLIDNGVLVLTDNGYEFTKDHIFSSSSAAAVVVMGRSASGPMEWRLENGVRLKETEEPQD